MLLQVGSASGEPRALASSRPPSRSGWQDLGQSQTCCTPGARLQAVGGGLLPALSRGHQPYRKAREWTMTRHTLVPFQDNTLQSPKSDTLTHHDPPWVLDSRSCLMPPMASGCHGSSRRKTKTAHYSQPHYSHPLPGTAPGPRHVYMNVHTCTYMHARVQMHTYAHACAYTHARVHAWTHTRTPNETESSPWLHTVVEWGGLEGGRTLQKRIWK